MTTTPGQGPSPGGISSTASMLPLGVSMLMSVIAPYFSDGVGGRVSCRGRGRGLPPTWLAPPHTSGRPSQPEPVQQMRAHYRSLSGRLCCLRGCGLMNVRTRLAHVELFDFGGGLFGDRLWGWVSRSREFITPALP